MHRHIAYAARHVRNENAEPNDRLRGLMPIRKGEQPDGSKPTPPASLCADRCRFSSLSRVLECITHENLSACYLILSMLVNSEPNMNSLLLTLRRSEPQSLLRKVWTGGPDNAVELVFTRTICFRYVSQVTCPSPSIRNNLNEALCSRCGRAEANREKYHAPPHGTKSVIHSSKASSESQSASARLIQS